jgi:hypothetical protein
MLCWCLLTCSATAFENPPARQAVEVGPELSVRRPDGSTSVSQFVGDSLRLRGDTRLGRGVTLEFSSSAFQPRNANPVRIVTLWTGETLPAVWSLSKPDEDSPAVVHAALFSDDKDRLLANAASAVASIRQPFGSRDTCPADRKLRPQSAWHRVESGGVRVSTSVDDSVLVASERKRIEVSPPLDDGLILMSGHWPIRDHSFETDDLQETPEAAGATLRFLFQTDEGTRQTVELWGLNHQRRIRLAGRERLSNVQSSDLLVQMRLGHGLTLSCDGVVVAQWPTSTGQLVAIEADGYFQSAETQQLTAERNLFLDEPLIRRVDRADKHSTASRRDLISTVRRIMLEDRVVLNSGDELFGFVDAADRVVSLRDADDKTRSRFIDREMIRAICFGRPDHLKTSFVSGVISHVDLVPDVSCSVAGLEEPFWIRTAIVVADREGLQTRHPLLGDVMIRWSTIRRVTPLFEGSYQLIGPGPVHLGNGYRETFCRVEPDGTELAASFQLTSAQVAMPTFLSADIAELIPSAPGTLKATPFLDEVRAGFLATQVFLNGEIAGTLNDLINVRSPATSPERVRVQLPARLLNVGENAIQLRQTSAKDDPSSFDDFEIRAIAIEIEHREQL